MTGSAGLARLLAIAIAVLTMAGCTGTDPPDRRKDPASGASPATNTSTTTNTTATTNTTTNTTTSAADRGGPMATAGPATPAPTVDTVDEIRAAVASAAAGDVIEVADGQYQFSPRLEASASGTAEKPITLRGSRRVVLRTKNSSGDYGIWITGDHWVISGITVAHASMGIVVDGSVGTVIDGVMVDDIGGEGVHFRSCSSDGVLRNSLVAHTGRSSPKYGEGVYVGSANANWSKFACEDGLERLSGVADNGADNTERVLIENNVFQDVTAEGADLAEGTDSGTLRDNIFRRTGTSGENSADSAVDARGNNWLIEGNAVSETDAPWNFDGEQRPSEFADGFQTHSAAEGYGTGNTFSGNAVDGEIPGFGFGLYPADGNTVRCDNTAPGASLGLVGDGNRPVSCAP